MDALLARFGVQAVNYAIRSGIALTSTYAIKQCSRLLKTVDDKGLRDELRSLQAVLNSKVKILSPAIDLIEFKSGRGNVFLESAVPLAKSLHRDIVRLGRRVEEVAAAGEGARAAGSTARAAEQHHAELLLIIDGIKGLLARIDRDIPLIQMAIGCSGETLSSSVPPGVSPSRLLQASAFLNFGDIQFANDPTRPAQIGPYFTLSLYMLFVGHSAQSRRRPAAADPATPLTPERSGAGSPLKQEPYGFGEGERRPIWQEVMHKARVRLCRAPFGWSFDHRQGYTPTLNAPTSGAPGAESSLIHAGRADEYSYHLEIIEDLDDGRVHDDEAQQRACPYDNIVQAGIRESIPIHQVSKIFYTDTGRILNIGNGDEAGGHAINPVLLLKRDETAPTPHRATDVASDDYGEARASEQGDDDESEPDDQDDVDRQLVEESEVPDIVSEPRRDPLKWHLPHHLDSEWLAFEVFVEDEDSGSSVAEDEDSANDSEVSDGQKSPPVVPKVQQRPALDSKIIAQIKNLAVGPPPNPRERPQSSSMSGIASGQVESAESSVAKSPFGGITSSLSLMEMLVRLTSLQEFQQASHLSIPDPILSFFLEETSTTGLKGEAKWKMRNEAKRRMGFDPYTDTPSK